MNMHTKAQNCVLAFVAILLTACGSSGSGNSPPPPVDKLVSTPMSELELLPNRSCDALKDYVADSIAELLLNQGGVRCIECVLAADGSLGVAAGSAPIQDTFESFTGTNNQEAGVDELDLVEADENGNLYTIDGHYVVVAAGLPPEDLQEIAQVKITDSGYVNGLLYDEQTERLIVVTSLFGVRDPNQTALVAPDFWGTPQVELQFFDVSNPSNPTLLKKMLTDGFEIAVRRIGSRAHLVSHFSPEMPSEIFDDEVLAALLESYREAVSNQDDEAIEALAAQIRQRVAEIVAARDAQDFLPGLWAAEPGSDYVEIPNSNCSVDMPGVNLQYALTAITSVDSDGENIATTAITNNAWSVYASESSIYLMQPSFGWWWDPLQKQETAIYKFSVGAGRPAFQAFGAVTGLAYDAFQFSENDGFLRVATHRNEREPSATAPTVDNNLYVLEHTAAGTLNVVGQVEGFGINEQIFSARFLGERGFVVTFRQIDPLFAFDLKDPFNPVLAGELEIPGVTTYIHPLSEDHLLTIGFNGDQQGLNPGYQLQIFDVQDLANPMLLWALSPEFDAEGFAWTRALWDHLAFNFFPEGGVLTIPVQYWSSSFDNHFSGFAAYGVDIATGFEELGRLDHSDLAKEVYCPDPSDASDGAICQLGWYLQAADPRRSVSASINDQILIYTFSDVGIKVSDAGDFGNEIASMPLNYPNYYWWLVEL